MMKNLITLIICLATITNTQWIEPNTTLPRADCRQAVGAYNKSIYLLGGVENTNQLIEFSLSERIFIDYGAQWIPNGNYIDGTGQYFTVINHTLYIKDYYNNALSIFSLKTKTFTTNYITNIPHGGGGKTCIASSKTHLFVVGGETSDSATSDVSVYDIPQRQWLSSIPSMQSKRKSHSCTIHPATDSLYAIAGRDDDTRLSSVETIEIVDIQQKTWTYIQSLTNALAWTRCVVHENAIYVIGGANNNWVTTDKVHVIHVLANEVTVFPDRMPLSIDETAPILVDDILYVFAGWNEIIDKTFNTWMMYDLSTPTYAPSKPPILVTGSPTSVPTSAPITSIPTTIPLSSKVLTDNPTTSMSTSALITSTVTTEDVTSHMTSGEDLELLTSDAIWSTVSTLTHVALDPNAARLWPQDTLELVLIIVSSFIAMLLCILCLCVILIRMQKRSPIVENENHDVGRKKKANKTQQTMGDLVHGLGNMNMNRLGNMPVLEVVKTTSYIEREGSRSASLVNVGTTVEGDGDLVHGNDMVFRQTKSTDGFSEAREYQNNPNIGRDEFVIDDDGQNDTNKVQRHQTPYCAK